MAAREQGKKRLDLAGSEDEGDLLFMARASLQGVPVLVVRNLCDWHGFGCNMPRWVKRGHSSALLVPEISFPLAGKT